MKVQNITNVDAFFKVVDDCVGKVELVAYEKEDTDRLIKFMLDGE